GPFTQSAVSVICLASAVLPPGAAPYSMVISRSSRSACCPSRQAPRPVPVLTPAQGAPKASAATVASLHLEAILSAPLLVAVAMLQSVPAGSLPAPTLSLHPAISLWRFPASFWPSLDAAD